MIDEVARGAEGASQAEVAYAALRGIIRAGRFPPGHVLSEGGLAAEVGVGRTPTRDAVTRLAHEGLLVRMPKRGVMITSLSPEDVRDLYEVRASLEATCMTKAVENMSEDELDDLDGIVTRAEQEVAAGMTWRDYREEDRRFHETLWAASRNRRLYNLLSDLHDAAVLDPWFRKITDMAVQTQRSIDEHRTIVAAIRSRVASDAEAAIRAHARGYQEQLAIRLFGEAGG